MNNAEIIKGIEMTIEGLNVIKSALTIESPKGENIIPFEPKKEANKESATYTVEELGTMKYNEFKKLASSLGVKCTGTRDEILARILELGVVKENIVKEEVESVEVSTEKEEVPFVESEVVEQEEDEVDTYLEMAKEIAEETDIEDIIEALADVGIKANKKNALTKLADAFREGLIEVEDEDEEEESNSVTDEDSNDEVEEVETEEEDDDFDFGSAYFDMFDPKGYNDPSKMTMERLEATQKLQSKIVDDIDAGKLTFKDVESFLQDNLTEEETDLLDDDYSEEEMVALYIEIRKRTIDNDGEEHEPSDPYEVGEVDMCCGHELKYSSKEKVYICEICGTEYEAE